MACLRVPIALVVLVIVASGCSLSGRSVSRYVDDQAITAAVKIRLAADRPHALARIDVDVFEGTVYLSGEVDTPEQKSQAEIAARKSKGIAQVVNDLRVLQQPAAAASPVLSLPESALRQRLPGLARLQESVPADVLLAYDHTGTLVATVYVRPLREVTQLGLQTLGPTVRPVDHVSVYTVPAQAGLPEAYVQLVLWHVSAAAAAALH